ncbi:MAG: cytochrome ubiquinol oxidase subunit I [Chloroflexota bacterium]|nr:cytochrome ubiquinol oxidase subunit I [Chloroflexota bacterium]
MNYPVWEVPLLGGGLLIAGVAIVHVFIAHFAIGGGLFLVLTEMKGYREGDGRIIDYVRLHSRFLILLTLVLGALTGVGIWFTISLVQPAGTSALIRNFMWIWAIEWVFFGVEIAAAFVYYYGWDRLDRRTHLTVGWIYFGAAWISLFLVNGIISFMLTPGDWLKTHNIQDAFFNPSFFPSTFMRTCVAVALAGLYAFVTAALLREEDLRANMIRYSARWLVPAFLLLPMGGLWYFAVIPQDARELSLGGAPVVMVFLALSVGLSALIFAYGTFGTAIEPRRFSLAAALVLLAMGLAVTGSSEWVREAIRKPYIIYDYMYANSIRVEDAPTVQAQGALASSKWATVRTVTPENRIQAGKQVFRLLCSSCHTVDGYNAIRPFVRDWPEDYIQQQLGQLNVLKPIMPPFLGNEQERDALAAWLATLGNQEQQP